MGFASEVYVPDKGVLGKRTELITTFENEIVRIATRSDLFNYFQAPTENEAFKLKLGHLIGLQTVATEIRNRKDEFSEKIGEANNVTNDTQSQYIPPNADAQKKAVATILEKLMDRLVSENIDTTNVGVVFKDDRPYVTCPICRHLFKVTMRKSKSTTRYELYDTIRHILSCDQQNPRKRAKLAQQELESDETSEEIDNSKYVTVKMDDILGNTI